MNNDNESKINNLDSDPSTPLPLRGPVHLCRLKFRLILLGFRLTTKQVLTFLGTLMSTKTLPDVKLYVSSYWSNRPDFIKIKNKQNTAINTTNTY